MILGNLNFRLKSLISMKILWKNEGRTMNLLENVYKELLTNN